jgi:hypothetical protein
MKWEAWHTAAGKVHIAPAQAPESLPWRCPTRFSGLSENCGCARFSDNSCVPPHLRYEYRRRAENTGARGADDERAFADVESYTW